MSVKIKPFPITFTEAAKLKFILFAFVCGLVDDAVIISDYTAANDRIINDLESIWK
jgi:hypothetical protein